MGRPRLEEIPYEAPTAEERAARAWAHCPDCDRDWPLRHFTAEYKCKNCRRAYGRKYTVGAKRRILGVSQEAFEKMIADQGGLCAVCAVELTVNVPGASGMRKTDACLDHDHANGRARGVLCTRCNAAIGYLADDPARTERAAQYLRHHVENPGPFIERKPELRGMRLVKAMGRGEVPTPPAPPPSWTPSRDWRIGFNERLAREKKAAEAAEKKKTGA